MRKSKYNVVVTMPGGDYTLFNCVSLGMVELTEEEFRLYETMKLPPEKAKSLVTLGLYVPSDISETDLLELSYHKARHDRTSTTLTISVTAQCNFSCEYCFEDRSDSALQEEQGSQILEFIEKSLRAYRHQELEVIWFGGEPLLNLQFIEHLTSQVRSLCDANNCKYKAQIITNGYLLGHDSIELLKALGIKNVQITLDGDEIEHNRSRNQNGYGSYRTIMKNIERLIGHTDLLIRLNINRRNHKTMRGALKDLKKLFLSRMEFLHINIAPLIYFYGSKDIGYLTIPEFAAYQTELVKYGVEIGIPFDSFNLFNISNRIPCGAVKLGNTVIDSGLRLHKCWNDVETQDMSIGNLDANKGESCFPAVMNEIAWNTYSPFKNDECKNCKLFPLCIGGCPSFRIRDWKHLDCKAMRCSHLKYNIADLIRIRASNSLEKNQNNG